MPETNDAIAKRGLPAGLWGLMINAFGIGFSEFITVGLAPTIAKDLDISISATGYLVGLYALGVAVGGPVLTALTNKHDRKKVLLGAILLFIVGNLIAMFSPNFYVLVVGRILTGFSHGVFFGIGAPLASSLVTKDKKATAIAIMFSGLTMATIFGTPLGTYIGQNFGWRMTFATIGIWGVVSLFANRFLLPHHISNTLPLTLKEQLRVLKNSSVMLVLTITIFGYGGSFVFYTYVAALLEKVTGVPETSLSLFFLMFGIGMAIGNMVGGRSSDKNPIRTLKIIFIAITVLTLALYFAIPYKVPALVVLFLISCFFFANVPALQTYIVQLSAKHLPGTENISSALNISGFNLGVALGSTLGGFIIKENFDITNTIWVSGIVVFVGFLLCIVSQNKEERFIHQQTN